MNGTLTAAGMLGPVFTTKAEFKLGPSVYDDLPLTGGGTLQLAGSRILPSRANLSVAGNQVDLQGSFGAAGDRLRFRVDAPQLERLGFGLAGLVDADGDVTGSFAHPNVTLNYKADSVVFGSNRVGHAEGHAELRDGANGALAFTTDAREVSAGGVDLTTLTAKLAGTRANHTFEAAATGKLQDRPLDLSVAANGKLTEARDGTRWDGTVTHLQNKGLPALNLDSPLDRQRRAEQADARRHASHARRRRARAEIVRVRPRQDPVGGHPDRRVGGALAGVAARDHRRAAGGQNRPRVRRRLGLFARRDRERPHPAEAARGRRDG